MISFERLALDEMSEEDSSRVGELNVFQTSAWLHFVADIQNAEPVIAVVKCDGRFLGYFTALISHVLGLRILGSPPKGPLTYFMGFNLVPDAPKREILQALPRFAFKELRCHYLELVDPNLTPSDWEGLPYRVENRHFYGIDLSKSQDELLAQMDSTGRNCIRKSIKNGVVIEEASDISFADEYYAQYQEVLAKHSLTPTYSLHSVRKMIEYILPTGNLLLLRARNPEGVCIATGIFLALGQTAVVWGAASWRQYQSLLPNELIAWHGMQSMRARGASVLNSGAKSEHFKEKLGARELQVCRLMQTESKLFGSLLFPLMSPTSQKYTSWALKRLSH